MGFASGGSGGGGGSRKRLTSTYVTAGHPLNGGSMAASSAGVLGQLYAVPFRPSFEMNVDMMRLNVSGAAVGGLFRIGLYTADWSAGRPAPSALLHGSAELTTDTTGFKTSAVATDAAVLDPNEVYFAALLASVAISTFFSTYTLDQIIGVGDAYIAPWPMYYTALAYQALPAQHPTPTFPSSPGVNFPMIQLRSRVV